MKRCLCQQGVKAWKRHFFANIIEIMSESNVERCIGILKKAKSDNEKFAALLMVSHGLKRLTLDKNNCDSHTICWFLPLGLSGRRDIVLSCTIISKFPGVGQHADEGRCAR